MELVIINHQPLSPKECPCFAESDLRTPARIPDSKSRWLRTYWADWPKGAPCCTYVKIRFLDEALPRNVWFVGRAKVYHFSCDPRTQKDQCPWVNFRAHFATHEELDLLLSFFFCLSDPKPAQCHCTSTSSWTVWLIVSSLFFVDFNEVLQRGLSGKNFHPKTIISPSILSNSRWREEWIIQSMFVPSQIFKTLHCCRREITRRRLLMSIIWQHVHASKYFASIEFDLKMFHLLGHRQKEILNAVLLGTHIISRSLLWRWSAPFRHSHGVQHCWRRMENHRDKISRKYRFSCVPSCICLFDMAEMSLGRL